MQKIFDAQMISNTIEFVKKNRNEILLIFLITFVVNKLISIITDAVFVNESSIIGMFVFTVLGIVFRMLVVVALNIAIYCFIYERYAGVDNKLIDSFNKIRLNYKNSVITYFMFLILVYLLNIIVSRVTFELYSIPILGYAIIVVIQSILTSITTVFATLLLMEAINKHRITSPKMIIEWLKYKENHDLIVKALFLSFAFSAINITYAFASFSLVNPLIGNIMFIFSLMSQMLHLVLTVYIIIMYTKLSTSSELKSLIVDNTTEL